MTVLQLLLPAWNLGLYILCVCIFLGPYPRHMAIPRLGLESELQLPEPQQHQIWAMSVTYTTAHGNTGSLTHWARAGTEPATSWFLVGFVNRCAMTGTPSPVFVIHLYVPTPNVHKRPVDNKVLKSPERILLTPENNGGIKYQLLCIPIFKL